MAKAPKFVPDGGKDWKVHDVLFARAGFSNAVWAEADRHEVLLVDLDTLGRDLSKVS